MNILGISAFYHDSAAVLIKDGRIAAAAQEERFSRKKHDLSFPRQAISFCLSNSNLTMEDIDYVVYYEKPFLKFERLLETYLSCAPKGLQSFVTAMPVWLKEKLFLKQLLKRELSVLAEGNKYSLPKILFTEHHEAHAASAFFPSPFEKAAILCLDGVGEWTTTSVWVGDSNLLKPQWQIDFPHSLGLLYSAFTYFCGFKVNSGEYKLMGLAPYGEPLYVRKIMDNLIDIKDDGTFRLNMQYFDYATGQRMINKGFEALFDGPPRIPESRITKREMDIACSIQEVTEEIILRLVRSIYSEFKIDSLCLAGGVALNCTANGRLLKEGPFQRIWIQPAAGDAGGALGAALAAWYQYLGNTRKIAADAMQGCFLGPSYSKDEIRYFLNSIGARYNEMEDDELFLRAAELLEKEKVVGWFSGKMEYGPRSLGNRSIIADARNPDMQSILNLKIKYRESFRPFAPAVIEEDAKDYFDIDIPTPYMLFVAPVRKGLCKEVESEKVNSLQERLSCVRSTIPAVTHINYSARVQTVNETTNPKFYRLLKAFKSRTACSVLINTSFNVRGEPIVCSPSDAYNCFMRTEMDYLVIENFLLDKGDQPQRLSIDNGAAKKKLKGDADDCSKIASLRRFGLLMSGSLSILFGILIPYIYGYSLQKWPVIVAAMLTFLSLVYPLSLRPLQKIWMRVGFFLGRWNSYIILSIVFFSIFTPIGLLMRMFGYDPLCRRFERHSSTYRKSSVSRQNRHMEVPY